MLLLGAQYSGAGVSGNIIGDTFTNTGDIVHNGTLCQSPFGKQLGVRLIDIAEVPHTLVSNAVIVDNPVVMTMRLLFLDDEDLKEY